MFFFIKLKYFLYCRFDGSFAGRYRGRGRALGGGQGPRVTHWPPQQRFYRPRHGASPRGPPPPPPHHNPWGHYPPAPHLPPPHARFPWGPSPAWDPRTGGLPAAPWGPAAAGLIHPAVTAPNNPGGGGVDTPRPQLDTRYIQNSALQAQQVGAGVRMGGAPTPPGAGPPLHVFPFGHPQFGGAPHFPGSPFPGHR